MSDLFHIIASSVWDAVADENSYEAPSLASEGFIHLSEKHQILRPANLLYRGRNDLKLLVLDPNRLTARVVFEPGAHGEAELFPHLYGPLDIAAVTRVIEFPCDSKGTFSLPSSL